MLPEQGGTAPPAAAPAAASRESSLGQSSSPSVQFSLTTSAAPVLRTSPAIEIPAHSHCCWHPTTPQVGPITPPPSASHVHPLILPRWATTHYSFICT